MDYLPHQQRVVDEAEELNTKKIALHKFFGNILYAELPNSEQVRLKLQYTYMDLYYEVLRERIQNFEYVQLCS